MDLSLVRLSLSSVTREEGGVFMTQEVDIAATKETTRQHYQWLVDRSDEGDIGYSADDSGTFKNRFDSASATDPTDPEYLSSLTLYGAQERVGMLIRTAEEDPALTTLPPCMKTVSDDSNSGCRMCAPYAHDGSELRNNTTDDSVLANVLFNDGDVHDAKSTTIYMAKYLTRDSV